MAKTTTVTITDDIDNSANAETYEFTYEGSAYSIDLSKKNKTALDKALRPYLDAATKVSGRGGRRSGDSARGRGRRQSSAGEDLAAIRAWAKENGHQVAERGRISQNLRDAYHAAH